MGRDSLDTEKRPYELRLFSAYKFIQVNHGMTVTLNSMPDLAEVDISLLEDKAKESNVKLIIKTS